MLKRWDYRQKGRWPYQREEDETLSFIVFDRKAIFPTFLVTDLLLAKHIVDSLNEKEEMSGGIRATGGDSSLDRPVLSE